MNSVGIRFAVVALLLCVLTTAGCPLLAPPAVLTVTPVVVDFGAVSDEETLMLLNTGSGVLTWTVEELLWVEDPGGTGAWAAADLPWLQVDAPAGNTTVEVDRVKLLASRAGLMAGQAPRAAIRITSNGGSEVIPVALTVPPTLAVSPQNVGLQETSTTSQFTVTNAGTAPQTWELLFVPNPEEPLSTTPLPSWLTATPSTGTLGVDAQQVVQLAWDFGGADPQDFSLLVRSDTDQTLVNFVFGALQIEVAPTVLRFNGLGTSAGLTITNNGTTSVGWRLSAQNLTQPQQGAPFSIDPQLGTLEGGAEQLVQLGLTATDEEDVFFGEGYYALSVKTDNGELTIPIVIEALEMPTILLSEPPNPEGPLPPPVEISTLDLGTQDYQGTFYVANLGDVGSTLYFRITHEDEGVIDPVIERVRPLQGDTAKVGDPAIDNVFYVVERSTWITGVEVQVTVNRNNLVEDTEYRTITITAWDENFEHPLEGLDPVDLQVRVERPPLRFEGAQHRSRPPFMLRFVFLLRDRLNQALDIRDPAVLADLDGAFTVLEDDEPIPIDETNSFVTYAEDLRYDLVLLLDYTGSMYEAVKLDPDYADADSPLQEMYAGDPDDPADEGLIGAFIRALPDTYNVALMEYHDRQQPSRLLHGFSNNDDSLIAALKAFQLPEGAHGVSELYDAVEEACLRLAAKDAAAEPFITDADVRAVIYISDGRDTSSVSNVSNTTALAQDLRVRLYPISFGEEALSADLIQMAADSGGYFYRARAASGLAYTTLEALFLRDPQDSTPNAPGRIVTELGRQMVLTYLSPVATGGSRTYTLRVDYRGETGTVQNSVETSENFMTEGDVRAGQLSLLTSGVTEVDLGGGAVRRDAIVYLRTEYMPRNISQMRVRFVPSPDVVLTTDQVSLTGLLGAPAKAASWRLIAEGNNIFTIITDEDNFLPYGAFGGLLRIELQNVPTGFKLGVRVDNSIYDQPNKVYFQYPNESLEVGAAPDIVAVALDDIKLVADAFDPTAPGAFDADGDKTRDFDDPDPLNPDFPPYFVDSTLLEFGSNDEAGGVISSLPLELYNGRFDDLFWQVESEVPGLSFSAGVDEAEMLEVAQSANLQVTLDRSSYAPGSYVRLFEFLVTNAASLSAERIAITASFTVVPTLSVEPESLTFPAWEDAQPLTIENIGNEAFNWSISVTDPEDPDSTRPPSFMIFDPPFPPLSPTLDGTTNAGATTPLTISIDRGHPSLQNYGTYDYTVEVLAYRPAIGDAPAVSRGVASIPLQIVVAGTPQLQVLHEGSVVTEATGLWLLTGEEELPLTLLNLGDELLTWDISLRYVTDPGILAENLPIEVTPASGTINPDENTPVLLTVDQPTLMEVLEAGNHEFRISIQWDLEVWDIPLTINLVPLPEIATVKEPNPDVVDPPVEYIDTLDFGTDEYQKVFFIANVGHQDSELYFKIEHDDQFTASPLIADVSPMQQSPENDPNAGYFVEGDRLVAASPIIVTIDRNNIEGEVDERVLTVVPVDNQYDRELSAVDRKKLTIRVERPPIRFEGAQNRSRPPFMLRFIFLLRDAFGQAIDTLDQAVFAQLQDGFTIYEDAVLLSPEETNSFVTYASDLRYNLVILLDYTGSMYETAKAFYPDSPYPLKRLYAGAEDDPQDVGLVGEFIRDLPDSYNIALMEYHDRQQANRLIHGFHTSDEVLVEALQEFSLAEANHGASQIFDALEEAVGLLVDADQDRLPLVEDADVRGVVFISDGWDTSSAMDPAQVAELAKEHRVRLYPIGFGEDVGLVNLITLAEETGGHFYRARQVRDYAAIDLIDLLASNSQFEEDDPPGLVTYELARQIVLTYITLLPGSHTYEVRVDYDGDHGTIGDDVVLQHSTENGDVRAGQLSLWTNGIVNGTADVYVRADYVPRNTSRFRFRFVLPDGMAPLTLDDVALTGLLQDDGTPPDDWRIIAENNNVFSVVTDEGNYLPYGAFGNLLRITFENVTRDFELGFRVDNTTYAASPQSTTFFQFPFGNLLVSGSGQSVAATALEDIYLVGEFDPDAPGAYDEDGDGTRDFEDPAPLDPNYPAPFAQPAMLDFGSSETAGVLTLTNERFEALEWSVTEDLPWLTLTPPVSGTLAVGEEGQLALTASRLGLPPARYTGTLMFEISAVGGVSVERVQVQVSMTAPPTMRVLPDEVVFPGDFIDGQPLEIRVENLGGTAFDWTVEAVDALTQGQPIPLPAPLTLGPALSGTTAAGGESLLEISVDRTGLDLGTYTYYLAFTSTPDRGAQVVPVEVIVAGTPNLAVYEGGDLAHDETVWLDTGETTTEFVLENTGNESLWWRFNMSYLDAPGISVDSLAIEASPLEGTLNPGETATVTVTTNQESLLEDLGQGIQHFLIAFEWTLGERNVLYNIDLKPLPHIYTNLDALYFGDDPDEFELDFDLGNNGQVNSKLNYGFEILGETDANHPLIVSVFNSQEDTEGMLWRRDGISFPTEVIRVRIDRSALDEETEQRTIRIYDTEIAAIEPVDVVVSVDQTPLTVEGAINRSRPPFVMRFVFLLRDMQGEAIPTETEEDREHLSFYIEEDDIQLHPDETNSFITGPENLKVNLVLMLDYTGSMYRAGTELDDDPLEPGEAIAYMEEAASQFIDDVPPTYRVALMEYHGRQQGTRLMHAFTTDKASLKEALESFTLAPEDHGASEINDAVVNATMLLANEDPSDIQPFDDADVRAVVFITDGWDTSSVNSLNDTTEYAKENRVRLYPLAFNAGEPVDNATVTTYARETGGHPYYAPNIEGLMTLLGNEFSLALDDQYEVNGLDATFRILNVGLTDAAWLLSYDADAAPWLSLVNSASSGTVLPTAVNEPADADTVTLRADASGLAEGLYEADVSITSNSGDATVRAQLQVTDALAGDAAFDIELTDEPGRIWRELRNQLVLTYVSLFQTGNHHYRVTARQQVGDDVFEGDFEEDGVYWMGDEHQGQVSLWTTGITLDPNTQHYRATAYARTDYVPRNIHIFRFRFFLDVPEDAPAAAEAALDGVTYTLSLVEDGLIADWHLITQGSGVYTMVTQEEDALQFGAFGNLLRLEFDDLDALVAAYAGSGVDAALQVGMRMDNTLYYSPTPTSTTKYFVYPGSYLNPSRKLNITWTSDVAPPSAERYGLLDATFDPDDPFAWDQDRDGVLAFDDPDIESPDIPEPFVAPTTMSIAGTETTGQVEVFNSRFDPMDWSVASAPAWVVDVAPSSAAGLQPGARMPIVATVDRTGLAPRVYVDTIVLDTNFGTQVLTVNMVVPE